VFDWKELEASITTEAMQAIDRWMKRHPRKQAYAVAFHECYCEPDDHHDSAAGDQRCRSECCG
jgi:hypothetical protein